MHKTLHQASTLTVRLNQQDFNDLLAATAVYPSPGVKTVMEIVGIENFYRMIIFAETHTNSNVLVVLDPNIPTPILEE